MCTFFKGHGKVNRGTKEKGNREKINYFSYHENLISWSTSCNIEDSGFSSSSDSEIAVVKSNIYHLLPHTIDHFYFMFNHKTDHCNGITV